MNLVFVDLWTVGVVKVWSQLLSLYEEEEVNGWNDWGVGLWLNIRKIP